MFDETEVSLAMAAANPGSVYRVVTFRNAHGCVSRGIDKALIEHFFTILIPGG